jgi:hypothetical protein
MSRRTLHSMLLVLLAGLIFSCQQKRAELPNPHQTRPMEIEGSREGNGVQTETSPNLPENHTVNWLERHASIARTDPAKCMECHQQDDCASCHTEDVTTPFKVHPPNFATIHAANPKLNTSNCQDCHKPETFCTSCHAKANVKPNEKSSPPSGYSVHPDGWLEPTNPRNHGKMARRNITECASCHTENDCVTCHQNINPHPPDFRMNCREWLDANARPCMECHASRRELRTMCR